MSGKAKHYNKLLRHYEECIDVLIDPDVGDKCTLCLAPMIHQKDRAGSSPLDIAKEYGREDVARKLMKLERELNLCDPQGVTPVIITSNQME